MREERRFAAAGRTEHDDVRLFDLGCFLLLFGGFVAVFHTLVVIVDRDRENFLRVILIDDVGVEIILDEVRARLLQHIAELGAERAVLLGRHRLIVLVEETVDLAHTVPADGKARVRIVNRHIVLVAHVNDALAETALMFDRIL